MILDRGEPLQLREQLESTRHIAWMTHIVQISASGQFALALAPSLRVGFRSRDWNSTEWTIDRIYR